MIIYSKNLPILLIKIAVFGIELSYLIDETKILNNGIIQSKEEDIFVGIDPD